MTLSYDMYPAKNNSPITVLTADLNSSDSVMTVENAGVLPDAPNLAVIGSSENAEIVLYTAKNGNNITIRRGFNNTVAGVWTTGTPVARNFTAYDHDTFIANIRDLENRKQNNLTFDTTPTADSTNPVTSGGIKTALDTKQDTLTFDTTPTADSTNPVESGGVKTALDAKQDVLSFDTTPTANSTRPVTSGGVYDAIVTGFRDVYKVTLPSASNSKKTFSAPGITADHVLCVEGHAYYTNKSAVMGELTLTTAANSITITGTLSGTTDIVVTLGIPRTITAS